MPRSWLPLALLLILPSTGLAAEPRAATCGGAPAAPPATTLDQGQGARPPPPCAIRRPAAPRAEPRRAGEAATAPR